MSYVFRYIHTRQRYMNVTCYMYILLKVVSVTLPRLIGGWFGVLVTAFVTSTKLSYIEPI